MMRSKYQVVPLTLILVMLFSLLLPYPVQAAEPLLAVREVLKLSADYDAILAINESTILVQKGERNMIPLTEETTKPEYTVLDFTGKELLKVTEYMLSNALHDSLFGAMQIIPTENPNLPIYKNGVINLQGELVIPVEYDGALGYVNGLISLTKDGKTGFADEQGEIIIPLEYEQAYNYMDQGFALLKKGENWYRIDSSGEILNTYTYDLVRAVSFPSFDPDLPLFRVRKGEAMGLIDLKGNIVTPLEFEVIKSYSEGLCWVKKNGLWGLLNTDGELILEPCYDLTDLMDRAQMYGDFYEGIAVVIDKDGRMGCINTKGELIIGFGVYEMDGNDVYQNRPVRVGRDDLWGFIDAQGVLIVEPEYDIIWPFYSKLAMAHKADTWFLLNQNGDQIAELPIDISTNPLYEWKFEYFFYDVSCIPQGDTYALIDCTGSVIADGFEELDVVGGEYPLVQAKKDGQWVILEVIPAEEAPVQTVPELVTKDAADPVAETRSELAILKSESSFVVMPVEEDNWEQPNMIPAKEIASLPFLLQIGSTVVVRGGGALAEMPQVSQIIADRTMLPLSYLVETLLGGSVAFDVDTQKYTIVVNGHTSIMAIGTTEIIVDGETRDFGAAPYLENEVVMAPLRAFEAMVSNLEWDSTEQLIRITP